MIWKNEKLQMDFISNWLLKTNIILILILILILIPILCESMFCVVLCCIGAINQNINKLMIETIFFFAVGNLEFFSIHVPFIKKKKKKENKIIGNEHTIEICKTVYYQ